MVDLSFIERLSGAHLLVAGEVGIDEYLWGDSRRISPEAPVPVVEVDTQSVKLGLSANVAQNITSLGGKVSLVTVCGQDEDGKRMARMLDEANVGTKICLEDPSRPTLRKVRVIAQKQHVVRIDYEKSHPLDASLVKKFGESLCDLVPSVDGVIVQDYGKGIWSSDTMGFVKHARAHQKPIFVDPSRQSSLSLYQNTTLLTPNLVEAEALTGMIGRGGKLAGKDDAHLQQMAQRILETTGAEHAIITCGEWGMVSVSRESGQLVRIPTFAREVFDVTGAGDTVIAVLSLGQVLGLPLNRCMQVANAAAGIVVGRIGASSVTADELKDELKRLELSGNLAD